MRRRTFDDDWNEPLTLSDGTRVTLRLLTRADGPLLVQAFAGLSDATRYRRFHTLSKDLSGPLLASLLTMDGERSLAITALCGDEIVGVARFATNAWSGAVEFALVVGDGLQRRGLGRALLDHLFAAAAERQITEMYGHVHADNGPMLRLLARAPCSMQAQLESRGALEVVVAEFAKAPAGPAGERPAEWRSGDGLAATSG